MCLLGARRRCGRRAGYWVGGGRLSPPPPSRFPSPSSRTGSGAVLLHAPLSCRSGVQVPLRVTACIASLAVRLPLLLCGPWRVRVFSRAAAPCGTQCCHVLRPPSPPPSLPARRFHAHPGVPLCASFAARPALRTSAPAQPTVRVCAWVVPPPLPRQPRVRLCCAPRQMSHEVEVMKVEMAKAMATANLLDTSNKQLLADTRKLLEDAEREKQVSPRPWCRDRAPAHRTHPHARGAGRCAGHGHARRAAGRQRSPAPHTALCFRARAREQRGWGAGPTRAQRHDARCSAALRTRPLTHASFSPPSRVHRRTHARTNRGGGVSAVRAARRVRASQRADSGAPQGSRPTPAVLPAMPHTPPPSPHPTPLPTHTRALHNHAGLP
jgi:hypothetical protein